MNERISNSNYPVIWKRLLGKAGPEVQVQSWGEVVIIATATIITIFFSAFFL